MLTVDQARTIADQWRPQFVDEAAFEQSWSRFFELVGDPDREKLHNWLAKDLARDAVKHAGIISEPVLPVRQSVDDSIYDVLVRGSCTGCGGDPQACPVCHGLRLVRRDVPIDHSMFGKAIPCPACNR